MTATFLAAGSARRAKEEAQIARQGVYVEGDVRAGPQSAAAQKE
jgi:hypothetical protein